MPTPALTLALALLLLLGRGAAVELANGDPRFGVAFALPGSREVVARQMGMLGAGSWYTYNLAPGAAWPPGRAVLLRTGRGSPRFDDAAIAAAARSRPGSAWLIGNEPNVPGQDQINGIGYVREMEHYRGVLKRADPTALIVAPNVQNLYAPCGGCEGAQTGALFLDEWRRAHRAAFNGEPEIDALGIHLYNLDWDRLPMTDAAASQRELEAARRYVDSVPAWRGKPIWITELGVIWGFPGYEQLATAEGSGFRVAPRGALDETAMAGYLESITRVAFGDRRLGVERLFVFTNAPYAEPFATAPGGIALFSAPTTDAEMTRVGEVYQRLVQTSAIVP